MGCSSDCFPPAPGQLFPLYRSPFEKAPFCQIRFTGRVLGKGTYGSVIPVYDRKSSLPGVLKICEFGKTTVKAPGRAAAKVWDVRLYPFGELSVMGRLRSCYTPYLLEVLLGASCQDFSFDKDSLGIMMPRAAGSVETLVDSPTIRLSLADTLRLAASMIKGAEILHDCGFLHLDTKPANFLYNERQFSAVVSDFGLSARVTDVDRGYLSLDRVGTAGYEAPELKPDVKRYTRYVDYYALGVVLAELICKNRPGRPQSELRPEDFAEKANQGTLRAYLLDNLAALHEGQIVSAPDFARLNRKDLDDLARRVAMLLGETPEKRGSLRELLALECFRAAGVAPLGEDKIIFEESDAPAVPQNYAARNIALPLLARLRRAAPARFDGIPAYAFLLAEDFYQRLVARQWLGVGLVAKPLGTRGKITSRFLRRASFYVLAALAEICPELNLGLLVTDMAADEALLRNSRLLRILHEMSYLSGYKFEDFTILKGLEDYLDILLASALALHPTYMVRKGELQALVSKARRAWAPPFAYPSSALQTNTPMSVLLGHLKSYGREIQRKAGLA